MVDLDTALYSLEPHTVRVLAGLHQEPHLSSQELSALSTWTLMALSRYKAVRLVLGEGNFFTSDYENYELTGFGWKLAARAAELHPTARVDKLAAVRRRQRRHYDGGFLLEGI